MADSKSGKRLSITSFKNNQYCTAKQLQKYLDANFERDKVPASVRTIHRWLDTAEVHSIGNKPKKYNVYQAKIVFSDHGIDIDTTPEYNSLMQTIDEHHEIEDDENDDSANFEKSVQNFERSLLAKLILNNFGYSDFNEDAIRLDLDAASNFDIVSSFHLKNKTLSRYLIKKDDGDKHNEH